MRQSSAAAFGVTFCGLQARAASGKDKLHQSNYVQGLDLRLTYISQSGNSCTSGTGKYHWLMCGKRNNRRAIWITSRSRPDIFSKSAEQVGWYPKTDISPSRRLWPFPTTTLCSSAAQAYPAFQAAESFILPSQVRERASQVIPH